MRPLQFPKRRTFGTHIYWQRWTLKKAVMPSTKLRPVTWVVSGRGAHNEVLVILSPYEANHLLPYIRSSDKVRLHLYTPRVAESMKPLRQPCLVQHSQDPRWVNPPVASYGSVEHVFWAAVP
ncbi:hypothetical protein HD554DRAFT_2092770, partial [Boletus coccyginus]